MDKQQSHGVSPVSPHLVCANAAEAMKFYERAFGAKEMMKLEGPGGGLMHGCVSINGASVMLMEENPDFKALSPKSLGGTPVTIHLMVPDVDKTTAQALAAGATVILPVADMFWGDRYGIVEDPYGHVWSIATHKRDMSQAEIQEAAKQAMCGENMPA